MATEVRSVAVPQAGSGSGGVVPVVRATKHTRVNVGDGTLENAFITDKKDKFLEADRKLRCQYDALWASFKEQN
jgi:hypothetical protein